MRRSFIFILCVMVCAGIVDARLLWCISSPEKGQKSYILGTHHTAPLAMLDSIVGFGEAFSAVDAVMGEMDMIEMSVSADRSAMMKYALAPADSTFSKVTTAAQRDSVAAFLAKHSGATVNFEHFEMFKPAMLTTTIAVIITQMAFPENNATGIDIAVQQNAVESGKQIYGLECPEFQYELLFGTPISNQVEDLMEAIRDEDKAIEQAREMSRKYLAQDLEGLYTMIIDPEEGMTPEEAERMIYSRNRAWIPQVEKQIATTPTIIVVGAGHLPGEQGLITLLRQSGYTVEAVE